MEKQITISFVFSFELNKKINQEPQRNNEIGTINANELSRNLNLIMLTPHDYGQWPRPSDSLQQHFRDHQCQSPPTHSPTRLKSSREYRNAHPAGLMTYVFDNVHMNRQSNKDGNIFTQIVRLKKKKFKRLRFDKIVRIKRKMLYQLHV